MTELGFEAQRSSRSAFTARDASPDSVIFTLDSNFSLFSSASASVDRCSFASDAYDRDSEVSPHCVGHGWERSSGPDLHPNLNKVTLHKDSRLSRKGDKAKAHKEHTDSDGADDKQISDSARSSFSLALKECQEKRSRSDSLSRKLDRQKPSSFDFNNATASSPRLAGVKKSSMATHRSGAFPSPGTPNYRHASFGLQKGWSSERVPLQSSTSRRNNTGAPFLSVNNNGRTLPSKWEDAERWILSPVSGDSATAKPSIPPPQRRPKSKSGPLGPPGVAYYSLYSPAMPMFEVGNMGNFTMGSPFSAGVIAADGLTFRSSGYHGGNFPVRPDPCMGRSASVHGCSEMLSLPSTVGHQDEKPDRVKDAATNMSFAVSRRDRATQMSPEGSACSFPERRFSFSASPPSALSIVELQTANSPKPGIKDVPVDEQVTLTRWSKKNRYRIPRRGSESSKEWKRRDVDAHASAWDISDTTRSISKVKREEAKITAWENLQRAKAEAAIRKLEMKLERKRSTTMDKIMKKLRSAQKKAQGMRSSVAANQSQSHQVARRTSHKVAVFRRTCHMGGSLSGCFTCHAF